MKRFAAFSTTILLSMLLVNIRSHVICQSLPDRYERIVEILAEGEAHSTHAVPEIGPREAKCGLWISLALQGAWDRLSHARRSQISSLILPPDRHTNRIAGHFRLYYDTTGLNAPALLDENYLPIPGSTEAFIDSAGRIFNEVWAMQVDSLGYDAPPLESDGTYHIYISELGFGLYGLTTIDPEVPLNSGGAPRYRTYIEIENDFTSVYPPSRGVPGLKVTAAHEFHHAIQIGAYGTWNSERYFYEITSTWMEDVVYDDVNDYYQYFSSNPARSSHFAHPEIRFTAFNGSYEYSRCIFGHFIENRFGADVMRRIWERMRTMTSFPAMEQTLSDAGSSFRQSFIEFAYWNSSTGPNADTLRFYPEGHRYPTIARRRDVTFVSPFRSVRDSVEAVASLYQPVLVGGEPMLVIVSNIDVGSAWSARSLPWAYEMSSSGFDGGKLLSNGLYVRLIVPDPENWHSWESVTSVMEEVLVYPNPYTTGTASRIKFQLPMPSGNSVRLTVLSADVRQVFSGDFQPVISPNYDTRIEWDAKTGDGAMLASGVYFYVIATADREYKGKFTVLRK